MLKSHYRDFARNQDKHWWYKGMYAINRALLDEYVPKGKNLKILDAGCGTGVILPLLANYGSVLGVDVSDEALKYASKRGSVRKGDVTKLAFRADSFDLLVCMDVIYHQWIKNPAKVLKGFNRVLKMGGLLLIREPAFNWLRGNEDIGSMTGRRFSKKQLIKLLNGASFEVVKISYANFFLFPLVLFVRGLTALKSQKGTSDIAQLSASIDELLTKLLKLEAFLIPKISLPFGSSLICVARKI